MVNESEEEMRRRYEKPAHAASEGQPLGQAPKWRRGQRDKPSLAGLSSTTQAPPA